MAVTAVATGTNPAWGVVYSHVTDSSADWAAVSNSTFFYDKADGLVHYKNSSGVVEELFGGADTNFATTDLSFTGVRKHDLNNNSLFLYAETSAATTKMLLFGRDGISTQPYLELHTGTAGGQAVSMGRTFTNAQYNGVQSRSGYKFGSAAGTGNFEELGTGLYRLQYVSGGTTYVQLGSSVDQNITGNLMLRTASGGAVTPSARLHVQGAGTTSATTAFLVENSAGTDHFKVFDDGKIAVGKSTVSNGIFDIEYNIASFEFLALKNTNSGTNSATNIRLENHAGTPSWIGCGANNWSGNENKQNALFLQANTGLDLKLTAAGLSNFVRFYLGGTDAEREVLKIGADTTNTQMVFTYSGKNASSGLVGMNKIIHEMTTTTAGLEDSKMIFQTSDGGSLVTNLELLENKIGFFNTTPVVQPSGTGETTGFTAGAGTGVNDDSTFTGNVGATAYRINDIVKALKNLGLLAQ